MKRNIILCILILPIFLSCSQSARNKRLRDATSTVNNDDNNERTSRKSSKSNIVKMKKQGGVYLVPIEVNGISMDFIFDTGASDVCISLVEAQFLIKQGKLTEKDVIGTQSYQIADGSISEGTIIILRTVKIGNKTLHDVKASIIETIEAPLLLGQSALSKFGKISIDYKKLELKLE
ncbi:MAG: retroviral-like aspartic protease family protein [Prevotellaceae bacterium]|nr:retroviral-like aspartic protease family protein [Prevotellaceae bacterium]